MRKSLVGSVKRACRRSASSRRSSGRSRTSWIDIPATIDEDVGEHARSLRASMSMRAKRGSIGSRAISRPRSVRVVLRRAFRLAPPLDDREAAHRAELDEQVERRLDAAGVGRREEREGRDVAEAEREHLQDDRRQARAQDLGLGELVARREVVFGVEADRDARRGAPGAARRAAAPRPARSPRWAAAGSWCGCCSARCARCRCRRRSGCRERSGWSRRRWWRG